MKNKFNIVIIGAGNIGANYDTPLNVQILTHAHAISVIQNFNLIGFVDIDIEKSKQAANIWGGEAFESIEASILKNNVDIFINAVPDEFHFEVLKKLSTLSIKCIITEKPLTKTLIEANDILRIYQRKNIPVAVNYSRRYIPEFEKLKTKIRNGKYGNYLTGNGYYGKGIIHNGSHLVDLLRYFFEDIKVEKVLSYEYDFYKDDPSISAILRINSSKLFYLQYINCNYYSIFEIDLLFERKRIRITNSGFNYEVYDVSEDEFYKDYKIFKKTYEFKTSLNKQLIYLLENVYNHITLGEKIKCSILDAYETLKICYQLIELINIK